MELAYAAIPEPESTQVRVKITYVGICGSDLEAYRGSRAPEFMTTPARLGHEVAGVLDKVGDKVVGLRVGDQVTCRYVWGESRILKRGGPTLKGGGAPVLKRGHSS
jgi:L-iditol 2-dehydrogenase